MDISRFGEFAILAQSRTFLDAAELLFMSQSTLSKHIMAMEHELGCKLIDRSQRHVTLTAQGEALLPYAQKIATLQHRYLAAIQIGAGEPLEHLTVGSIPIMAPYGITDAVIDFQQANPSYSVELIEGEGDRRTKALLEELYAAVVRGETLAEAMRRSGAFRPLECGVVRIGNETGRLARTLDFLRDYYRKRAAQQRMVASAVSYPVVILAVAAAVVAFMLSVVVPMFEEVYARMGGELPALTRGIIALSKAFPAYAAVAVSAGGGLYLLYRANRQREEVQRWRAAILLRLPVAGEIIRKNMQAQCCKLLDLLCAAGVPLLAGVGMLREVIGFHPYRKSFDEIARRLERGDAFAETLARFPDLYDRKLTALVRVGEQTNRLPEMLRRQGETLTEELEYAIRRMGAMLEPALILLVGILVAVILIAMYMPMFSLGGIMG